MGRMSINAVARSPRDKNTSISPSNIIVKNSCHILILQLKQLNVLVHPCCIRGLELLKALS